jgi:hypothetical protein
VHDGWHLADGIQTERGFVTVLKSIDKMVEAGESEF